MAKKVISEVEKQLLRENQELQSRLYEAEETLNAIRNGDVDAIVVSGSDGEKVFSISSAETPYRIIIEEMNEGAVVLSSDGIILYCNHRFAELLSISPEQIIGSYFNRFVPKGDIHKYNDLLQVGLKEKTNGELTYRKDGVAQPVYLHLSFSPLPPDMLGDVCIMATDVSELKLKGDELLRSHETLEKKVIERTSELSLAIEKLEASRLVALKAMEDAVKAKDNLEVTNKKLFKEIDERIHVEEKLKESEYFFRVSQQAAFTGSYKNDFKTVFGSHPKFLIRFLELTRHIIETLKDG